MNLNWYAMIFDLNYEGIQSCNRSPHVVEFRIRSVLSASNRRTKQEFAKMKRFEPSLSMVAEIALLAQQYRTVEVAQYAAQKELARAAYNEALQRHHASGWNGAVGEPLEIPDVDLPAAHMSSGAPRSFSNC
jgi:hypothetical protein